MYIESVKNDFSTKSSSANRNIILLKKILTIKNLAHDHVKIIINYDTYNLEKNIHILLKG